MLEMILDRRGMLQDSVVTEDGEIAWIVLKVRLEKIETREVREMRNSKKTKDFRNTRDSIA